MTESIFSGTRRKAEAVLPQRTGLAGTPSRPTRRMMSRTVLGRVLQRLVEYLVSWYQGWTDRRQLASLDDRMLRDLGIDRAIADTESTMSHWRLPKDR